jgi:NAD(P)-dependent dehydrogenase (short-subunit alcohol dehydrogenase family)
MVAARQGRRSRRVADRDRQPHQLRRHAGIAHYGAAKSAVAALIRNFALELGPHGVRANMVCAGLTKTEMVPFDDSHPFGQAAIQKIPLGRMADPDEIAGVVVYLLSDAARYHTGDLITVDGGRMIYGV